MATLLRYKIEHHVTSIRENDHNARFTVRRNGKVFHIEISPSKFVNSPVMTKKYLSYLEVLKSGEEVLDDIYDTDVYEWVMLPFEPFFAELAPSPAGDPMKVRVTLKEYLFPAFFFFSLDILDEKLRPRLIPTTESPYWPSFVRFDDDFLDDLEKWTALYDPAGIILSYKDPEDALFKTPKKILVDTEETECFFKPCHSSVQVIHELKAYEKIHAAGLNLDSRLNLCHLHGVVMDDYCGGRPLSTRVHPDEHDDPPAEIRGQWIDQLEATLAALHKNGIIWGDVKAENVLIDTDNNAWITDFGGGYTEGWVAKEVAGTVTGDWAGMAELRKLLLPLKKDEPQI